LIDIFINLSSREEFVKAVAKDGRSYDRNVFHRAAGILGEN
jgi:ubiquitin conjugation factor E4 B